MGALPTPTPTPRKQEIPPQEPEQPYTIDQISTNGTIGGTYNDRSPMSVGRRETLTGRNSITPDRQAYRAYEAPSTAYRVQSPPIINRESQLVQQYHPPRVQSPPIVKREVPHVQQYDPPQVPRDQYPYTPILETLNDGERQSRRKTANGRNG